MSNPILRGVNPDPTILRVGDDYFVATSSFEYFPGVPIYHSTNLVDWSLIGHALNRSSQLDMRTIEPGGGVWAPTLRFWKGRFYLATCPLQPQGFYVSTDNIWDEKSWTDPIYFDMLGIDQDLFFDDDGKVYLCTARFRPNPGGEPGRCIMTYGCEIDLSSGDTLGRPSLLRIQAPGVNTVAEGPHIIKRAGWYYLFTADGGTGDGHSVVVSRSRSPLGPYDDPPTGVNPLVRNAPDHPTVQRTGHADLMQSGDGSWWAVLLGIRQQTGGGFQLGRETFLVHVKWSEDGWPQFNDGHPVSLQLPASLPARKEDTVWKDTFEGHLRPGWYSLRTPTKLFHRFNEGRPGLVLRGNGHVLEHYHTPAALFRKQPFYSGSWSTVVDFDPSLEGEQAGVTVFYSGDSFAAMFITLQAAERRIVLRWTDPDTRSLQYSSSKLAQAGPVLMEIIAAPTTYTFRYRVSETTDMLDMGTLSARVLDGGSEGERNLYFVGVHFGLFTQGVEGETCDTSAHFQYAQATQA